MRTQKGSLMIEVIAVLGLIALITPVLFRQVARRNEDIVAMQVASEMRAVKDALAAYIQAYEQNIAENCDLTDGAGNYVYLGEDNAVNICDAYNSDQNRAQVSTFFAGNAFAFNDYGWAIYGYTVPANVEISDTEENKIYRPVLYGVVYQEVSEETLRMASKIAGLIGLDGGVVTDESETALGVQGAWDLDLSEIIDGGMPKNTVVAVTSFDDATNTAILKDVKLEHFAGETMQATTSTSSRMAVSNLLSVGDKYCIIAAQNPTVQVVGWGEKDGDKVIAPNCAPLFEVNAKDGVVRLAGVLTGEEIGKGNCATLTTKAACEAAAYCTWDAEGGENDTGVCEARHKIDLSAEGISSMHDIKLTSRGGAKLSDLLPTYSLKGYETIINNTTTTTTATVGDFDCGSTGTKALIVVPTKVIATTSESEELAHTHTVTVTMTHEPAEGSLDVTLGKDIKEAIVYKYCVFEDGTTTTPAD